MQHSTSRFLKNILAGGASAALLLLAALPAAAHGHNPHAPSGAPAARGASHAYSAPRTYAAPRAYARRTYAAPRAYAHRTYAAPRAYAHRMYAAPRAYAHRTYAAPRAYAHRTYAALRAYAHRNAAVRDRFARQAPFMERTRVAPYAAAREHRAPFVEYVRAPQHRRTYAVRSEVVRSPLMRAVFARRARRTISYHPAYLAGRIVSVRRDVVVLQPPAGAAIPVNCDCYRRMRPGSYITVPVVYANDGYTAYPYSPQYYPQVAQWYSNYYGAPVTYANGYGYYGDGDNDEAQYSNYDPNAGHYSDGANYQDGGYYGSAYPQQPYYANGSSPYDNCMWSDNDGDEGGGYCAAPQAAGYYGSPYGYSSYGTPYAPQQVQGLVVAKTGSILMLLGTNGLKPIVVDDAAALQNGYSVNGPVAVGQVVDAYGFYNGDTFMATALM